MSVTVALSLTGCNNSETTNAKTIASAEQQQPVQNNALTLVRTVEGIQEYSLENGMTVLLYPDASQPKTLVNVTYSVGSKHEHYGETGMAHLLEHMLFKGSTNYTNIDKEFKKRGMAKNASTWTDRTNYYEIFDANEDSLIWALGMEADRMVNASFTEEQLKSEMSVVRNEMERSENDASSMLQSRMSSMAFLWHNYGKSTIGARSDVENFPFSKLRAFYKKHYRPDNATLIVAGRFDDAKTKALIEQNFGKIVKPATAKDTLYTVEPVQDGERSVNLRRVGDVPYVGLSYHAPSSLHEDAAALAVLTEILGNGTRGRLQKEIVKKGLASSAQNFIYNFQDSSQVLFLLQGSKGSDMAMLENELLTIVEGIAKKPITQEEVDLAQAKLAREDEQAMRDVTRIGMALSEYIAMGDYRHVFYMRDLIAGLSVEKIQAAAEKYLIQSNRTTGRFIPTDKPVRAEMPAKPNMDILLKDYVGKEVVSAGEIYDNTVSNINDRLVRIDWAEGTKVSVYPKILRGGQIIINMHFPSGSAANLSGKGVAISFVGDLIKQGNEKYSKDEIASKLDQLKSSIYFNSSADGTDIKVSTDKEHLDETIKFFSELMATPTFPTEELEVLKRAVVASFEQQRKDPGSIASNNYKKALYDYPAGHPKAFLSIDQTIAAVKAVNSEQLAMLYKKFTNINNGHISIIGDVKAEEISDQLHGVLSSYSNDTDYQRMERQYSKKQGLVVSTETPNKANSKVFFVNAINMQVTHPDHPAVAIAAKIFGGDAFTSRIGARIRVKEGYSYSVAGGTNVNTLDKQGTFWGMAISAPENMDNVVAAFKEEIAKVVSDGFTEAELEQAVKGFVADRNRRWSSDFTIASILISATKFEQDLVFYDEQIKAVENLTLEQVNAAFIKYLASQKTNVFKAGDFAKVKK